MSLEFYNTNIQTENELYSVANTFDRIKLLEPNSTAYGNLHTVLSNKNTIELFWNYQIWNKGGLNLYLCAKAKIILLIYTLKLSPPMAIIRSMWYVKYQKIKFDPGQSSTDGSV